MNQIIMTSLQLSFAKCCESTIKINKQFRAFLKENYLELLLVISFSLISMKHQLVKFQALFTPAFININTFLKTLSSALFKIIVIPNLPNTWSSCSGICSRKESPIQPELKSWLQCMDSKVNLNKFKCPKKCWRRNKKNNSFNPSRRIQS